MLRIPNFDSVTPSLTWSKVSCSPSLEVHAKYVSHGVRRTIHCSIFESFKITGASNLNVVGILASSDIFTLLIFAPLTALVAAVSTVKDVFESIEVIFATRAAVS